MRFPAARFALAQSALNLLGGVYLPFFPLWLQHNDISPQQTSLILGVGMITRVFVAPVAGLVADALNDRRLVAIAIAALSFVLFGALALFGEGNGFWPIFVLTVTAATFHSSLGPIIETQTARGADDYGFHYSRVRAIGSFSFVVANYMAGIAVGAVGVQWIAAMVAALVGVQILCFLPLPQLRRETAHVAGIGLALRRTLTEAGQLVRHRTFLVFIAATGAAQAAHGVYYAMGSLNFERLGYSTGYIGFLWGLGVFAEVLLFLVAPWLTRGVRGTTLIALGVAAGAVRWTAMAFDVDPITAAALQVLHAGSFGLVHLGTMQFLTRAVPLGLAATAQSLFAVAAFGLATGAVTFAAGPLFDAVAGYAYLLSAALSAAGLVLTLALAKIWNGDILFPSTSTHGSPS